MTTIPPVFKIKAFINRAEELDKDTSRPESAIVAYYCRFWALELAIKKQHELGQATPADAQQYLLNLMDQLEEKKKQGFLPETAAGKQVMETFALEVFEKADDEDRQGRASKATARTYYAASNFMDALQQFGEVEIDIAQKKKYAKFKANDILKAIKEGRQPTPGAPGEEPDLTTGLPVPGPEGSLGFNDPMVLPAAPMMPLAAPMVPPAAPMMPPAAPMIPPAAPPQQFQPQIPPAAPSYKPAPAPAPAPMPASVPAPVPASVPAPMPVYQPAPVTAQAGIMGGSGNGAEDAIELAKFAIAALEVKDTAEGHSFLQRALNALSQ